MDQVQPQKTNEKDGKLRLDQRLTQDAQTHIIALLNEFPELRSVAVAFDYELKDPGSLPAGTWLPRNKTVEPAHFLSAAQSIDKVSFSLRYEHDRAQSRNFKDVMNKLAGMSKELDKVKKEDKVPEDDSKKSPETQK